MKAQRLWSWGDDRRDERVTFRLSAQDRARLSEACAERNTTEGDLVRRAVFEYLAKPADDPATSPRVNCLTFQKKPSRPLTSAPRQAKAKGQNGGLQKSNARQG